MTALTLLVRVLLLGTLLVVVLVFAAHAVLAWEAGRRRRAHRARARVVRGRREDRYERLVRRASAARLAAWR